MLLLVLAHRCFALHCPHPDAERIPLPMTRIKTSWMVVWAIPFFLFLTRPASPQNIDRAPSLSTTSTNSLSSSISASTSPHASEATYFNLPPADLTFGFNTGTLDRCPGPLIHNIHNLDIPTCHGSCCIKCPAWKSFHEPNVVQHLLLAMYVVHQISLACKIFLVISYLVLPGKRGQPHTSVLLLFISDSLWFASFNIMPGISNSCVNDFEISTAQNSRSCGIQGVLIIYFIHTTVLWCSLLIYKLHLLAVWRSDIVERYFGWIAAFCWMFPLVFVVPIAVKGLAQYPGVGASCLVSHANLNTYLFYPTAAYFYPALLLHLFTASKMIHVAIVSSKVEDNGGGLSELSLDPRPKRANRIQFKRLLRNQWRPALMLTLLTCCITFFWLYVFLENQHKARYSPKAPWIDGWLECLLMNDAKGATPFETQTICAKQTASQRPSIILFGIVEMLVASSGIIIAVIFTAKAEFWTEWSSVLQNARGYGAFKSWMERRRRRSSTFPIMQNHEHDLHPHQLYDPKERKGSRVGYDDTPPVAFGIDTIKEHGHAQRHTHSDDGRTVCHQQHQMYLPGGLTSNAEPSPLKVDAAAVPIVQCLARPEKGYGDINSPNHQYEKQHVLPLPVTCPPSKPKDLQIAQQKLCSPQLPTLPLDSLPLPVLFAFPSPPPTCPLGYPTPRAECFPSMIHAKQPSAPGPPRRTARSHSSGNSDEIMLASRRSIKDAKGICLDKAQIESLDPQIVSSTPPTIPSKNPAGVRSHIMHRTAPPLYPPPSPPQSKDLNGFVKQRGTSM